jgi:hypothetical protein
MALCVIRSAALWVDQYVSRTRNLNECLGCFGRAPVEIRMLQAREPLVCSFDLFY